ncbi:MAG: site-specific integrase [Syntrophaceae bacterium]|nr:site-specific integrase [Syntrophaceae bacterium]
MKLFLNQGNISQLLDLAKEHPRDLALFQLALSTGLRISDVLALKIHDLQGPEDAIVRILRVKTKKTKRWVDRPLRDDCRNAIQNYLETRIDNNPYLFPSKSKKQQDSGLRAMHRMSAHRIFKKYLCQIFPYDMLRGASTHSLRRSVAKLISQHAGRIEPATMFLGHHSVASTAAYIDMNSHEERANHIVLEELDW